MSMNNARTDPWDTLWSNLEAFINALGRSHAVNVNSVDLRDAAKRIVQDYFRIIRPALEGLPLTADQISQLDGPIQRLLELSNGRNSKQSYNQVIRALRKLRPVVEGERELLIGKQGAARGGKIDSKLEEEILKTLSNMVPSAALSYEQAIRDLAGAERISARGTAAELREVLREVLDYLAPDADVMKSEGFKLEKDRDRPTMKQKARFILKSRGMGRTVRETPEAALQRIEESVGVLARSVYERGSVSTHISANRTEVRQLKLYVEGVLAELLEIHK
jgi:hypothetical protein